MRASVKLSKDTYYNFDLGPAAERLVGELLYPYEVEIRIGNSRFVFGRFSIGLIGRLIVLSDPPSSPAIHFHAGSFIESHPSSKIIIGGEHPVSSVLHNSFGVYGKIFTHLIPEEEKRCIQLGVNGVTLGDGVILSAGCTIIDGTNIAHGTVLAAGAVAVGDCDPYCIYGGVPAKRIKRRLTDEQIAIVDSFHLAKVRSHCLPITPSILQRLERGEIQIAEAQDMVEYMTDTPRIIIDGSKGTDNEILIGDIISFQVGSRIIDDKSQIKTLREYFSQLKSKRSNIAWSPDVFHAIGAS